jgi:aspartyl-tRNA(Asn)/glutamyl-tRNA(Gln) amidotransferase subunit B
MVESGKEPEAIIAEKGLAQISDAAAIEGIVARAVAANPQAAADWKAGKEKAFNALLGAVMRETRGRANPQVVRDLLKKALDRAT